MRKLLFILGIFILFACNPAPKSGTDVSEDVEATDEKIDYEIINFDDSEGEAAITRNFYFLFDISGSMDQECAGKRKIDGAKDAIYEFLESVPDNVNIGLLFLGVENQYGVEEMLPLGQENVEQFKSIIADVKPAGGTPLANAIHFGKESLVKQYKTQLGYGEYRLIVITDGIASYPDQFKTKLLDLRRYPFIALYGIGLCMAEQHVLKEYSIQYTDAYDYNELRKALEETIAEAEDFDPLDFNSEDFKNLVESE